MEFSFTSYGIRTRAEIGLRKSKRITLLERELDEIIFMDRLEGLISEDYRFKSKDLCIQSED